MYTCVHVTSYWIHTVIVRNAPVFSLAVVKTTVCLCVVKQWMEATFKTIQCSLYQKRREEEASEKSRAETRWVYHHSMTHQWGQLPSVCHHPFCTLHSVARVSQYGMDEHGEQPTRLKYTFPIVTSKKCVLFSSLHLIINSTNVLNASVLVQKRIESAQTTCVTACTFTQMLTRSQTHVHEVTYSLITISSSLAGNQCTL